MAKFTSRGITSRVTAVSMPLRAEMEKAEKGWGIRALQVAAFAGAFLGLFGLGTTHLIDRVKNSAVADNKKETLAKYYRNQVAAQLGMDPAKVSIKDLELAARVNPMFANALSKVTQEQSDSNRASLLSVSGAGALGGWLPGVSGVNYMVAHATGAVAGGVLSSFTNKEVLHTQDVMEMLNEKRLKGQPIQAIDVALLRISQNEELQHQLKKQNGTAFHRMNEAQQAAIIHGMPGMSDAAELAQQINAGLKTEQDVLMAVPASAPQGKWAKFVGGSRATQGSYVDGVNSERALAAQGVSANAI